ncbi:MAG: D-glycero-beta-D-manno-heptose 1,7-bisphosphate 7-phosphatase [Planctomycetes bacterium]|nr:D-glycero-beta-D-manno-heptose 1,7-bisphosphate 7-phosphatase [Planctomycetota bacterium]MDA0948207.1 D-glycero-beta-D-manno-heptose 1,7-bisphosphate 7-phosphatase [Planctomycetota bacterium]
MSAAGRAAIFLDRDGTLNREVDYLRRVEDLELLPGVARALERLSAAGFALVVVTNQSGIGRGLLDEEQLAAIHARLRVELRSEGVELLDVLWCPHLPPEEPGGEACACRKPAAGMLLEAARRHGLDLERSWTVGDSLRDAEAGAAAGTRPALVRTGKPLPEECFDPEGAPVPILADLMAFAERVLASPDAS